MTADPSALSYIVAVLWLFNGDPMLPQNLTQIPNEPSFPSRRVCMAYADERYGGAIDPRAGIIVCVPK